MKAFFMLMAASVSLLASPNSQAFLSKDQLTLSSWCYATDSGANFEKWDFRVDGKALIQVLRINGVGVNQTYSGTWYLNGNLLSISAPDFRSAELEILAIKGDRLEFSNDSGAYSCF